MKIYRRVSIQWVSLTDRTNEIPFYVDSRSCPFDQRWKQTFRRKMKIWTRCVFRFYAGLHQHNPHNWVCCHFTPTFHLFLCYCIHFWSSRRPLWHATSDIIAGHKAQNIKTEIKSHNLRCGCFNYSIKDVTIIIKAKNCRRKI